MKKLLILFVCISIYVGVFIGIGSVQASTGTASLEQDIITLQKQYSEDFRKEVKDSYYGRVYLSMKYRLSLQVGEISLSVPFHHELQTKSLSCEANAATDLINYYRLNKGFSPITEAYFLSRLPIHEESMIRVKHQGQGSSYIWGDPDKYFVGQLNGKQSSNRSVFSGYGISPTGIAPVIKNMLLAEKLTVQTGALSEHNILSSLAHGNPIMFWYILPTSINKNGTKHYDTNPISWQTLEGKYVNGYIGQHVGIIVGAHFNESGHIQTISFYQGRKESLDTMDFEEVQKFGAYFPDGLYVREK